MINLLSRVSILPYILAVTLLVSLFTFPQLTSTYFQTALPVQSSEEIPNNMPLVENLEDQVAVFHAHPAYSLIFSTHELSFPLHHNLTPFLVITEFIKPPSLA